MDTITVSGNTLSWIAIAVSTTSLLIGCIACWIAYRRNKQTALYRKATKGFADTTLKALDMQSVLQKAALSSASDRERINSLEEQFSSLLRELGEVRAFSDEEIDALKRKVSDLGKHLHKLEKELRLHPRRDPTDRAIPSSLQIVAPSVSINPEVRKSTLQDRISNLSFKDYFSFPFSLKDNLMEKLTARQWGLGSFWTLILVYLPCGFLLWDSAEVAPIIFEHNATYGTLSIILILTTLIMAPGRKAHWVYRWFFSPLITLAFITLALFISYLTMPLMMLAPALLMLIFTMISASNLATSFKA